MANLARVVNSNFAHNNIHHMWDMLCFVYGQR